MNHSTIDHHVTFIDDPFLLAAFQMKWPTGFAVRNASTRAYEITPRKLPLYESASCGHQTTVIADTIFEKTRTDLLKWFWAIYLIGHDKRGISATQLSEELEVAYQTAPGHRTQNP